MTTLPRQPRSSAARAADPAPPCRVDAAVYAGGAWQSTHADAKPLCKDGKRMVLTSAAPIERVRVIVTTPLLNYAHVVIPDCGRHYIDATKALNIRAAQFRISAPNAGHPFFALADEAGGFHFAFGLLNVPGDVTIMRLLPHISSRRAMVGGDEDLALQFEWSLSSPAPSIEVDYYAAARAANWFEALRSYTDLIRQREELVYPTHPAAWDPVWCTWTAFPSYDMTAQRVLDNAHVARTLGIKTVILDDGWFGPGLDDDQSGPINHGDYAPDPRKFSDLRDTVQAVQQLGMRMLLWHAPLCVAPTSRAYDNLWRYLIAHNGREFLSVNGLAQLCPACPQVRAYVAAETRRLLTEYGADGLKVDLFNCLPDAPCDSHDHEHDIADPVAALDALLAEQWRAARKFNPEALVELKQDYGNVRLIRHGTMVRAGDTAYDMDSNCRRCFYTQAFAPCVHVDPLVTSIHTAPRGVALMMIKALAAGVPTFSMDLPRLPESHRRIIGKWLNFYNEHRPLFVAPRAPTCDGMNVWSGRTGRDAWVAPLFDAQHVTLPDAPRVWLLNGTGRNRLYLHDDRNADGRAVDIEPAGMTCIE